jgi:hypothetical protein
MPRLQKNVSDMAVFASSHPELLGMSIDVLLVAQRTYEQSYAADPGF